MKRGKTILIAIAILLICISTLPASASFYVAAINPDIGTMTSSGGTSQEGLGIQRTVSASYRPFVIVVNNMDKKASEFKKESLKGPNSVFIINNGAFEAYRANGNDVSLDNNTITSNYKDDNLKVKVGDEGEDFYSLKVTENENTSYISFSTIAKTEGSKVEPQLSSRNGNYTLKIPENYRYPIKLSVNGNEISLSK